MAAAKEGRGERDRPLILSLTFLSSLNQDDLRALMMNENLELDEYVRVFYAKIDRSRLRRGRGFGGINTGKSDENSEAAW